MMKIKTHLLQQYLQENKMTAKEFAEEVGISLPVVGKLLCGESVGERTAQLFICYFGAYKCLEFMDWEAMGKKNPFESEV